MGPFVRLAVGIDATFAHREAEILWPLQISYHVGEIAVQDHHRVACFLDCHRDF